MDLQCACTLIHTAASFCSAAFYQWQRIDRLLNEWHKAWVTSAVCPTRSRSTIYCLGQIWQIAFWTPVLCIASFLLADLYVSSFSPGKPTTKHSLLVIRFSKMCLRTLTWRWCIVSKELSVSQIGTATPLVIRSCILLQARCQGYGQKQQQPTPSLLCHLIGMSHSNIVVFFSKIPEKTFTRDGARDAAF